MIQFDYLFRKILFSLITLAIVIVFNFFLFRVLPGDPVKLLFRNPRLTKQAQEHLGHGVADKVQHDLGRFTGGEQQRSVQAPTIVAAQPSATAAGVAQMMKDPAGLKQAFVLNLILNRPTFGGTRRIR